MSRMVLQRWELTGTLVAQSQIHVGGHGDGPPQLVLARDGLDRPVLPGTSLAGVIKAALGRLEPAQAQVWEPGHDGDDATGEASRICVDDAPAPAATPAEIREHVAIDRIHGVATNGHLYSREVLPAGTPFPFCMIVEGSGGPAAEALIMKTAALLRGPGVRVGAATTRGLGHVRLEEASLVRYDLATRAGMIAALTSGGVTIELPAARRDELPPKTLRITIPWRPRGPLAVHVSADGDVVDAFPLAAVHSGAIRLELPGSTIKGVLRSHAERILRTVTETDAPEDFAAQMSADRAGPIGALFGTAADRDTNDSPIGRRGALRIETCVSETALPAQQWQAVRLLQRGADDQVCGGDDHRQALARLQRAVDALNAQSIGLRFVVAPHVAVDRWTAGAAEGRLFATLEPHCTAENSWRPIVLELDVDWLAPDPVDGNAGGGLDSALALLLLVLRDLCDGWIGFGHATTRGSGAVEVEASRVTFQASQDLACHTELDQRSLADLLDDNHLTERLMSAWSVLHASASTGSQR